MRTKYLKRVGTPRGWVGMRSEKGGVNAGEAQQNLVTEFKFLDTSPDVKGF